MKIKVKGFKSLIKAVQNRAHLFPIKVLIRAKNKTYYGIRYKTGNKAMEFTKKQMKIPNNVEALFDTKDGKRKNLSENDVLRIYDKAGKPGSLQDFIKKNFKKPYVKPRNSTTVDLEQQQMSIDDLMQGSNKKEQKIESGITITGPIYDDDERPTYYINDNGNVIETQDTKIVDQYRQKQKESKNQAGTDYKDDNANNKNTGGENPDKENKNKENEDKKNAWNDDYYKTFYEKLDAIYKKYRGSISFFSPEAELILKEFIADKVGLDREGAINAWKAAIEELVVPKPNNENQKDIPKDADGGLDFAKLFEKDRALKEQRDKQWVKERNAEVEPRKSIANGDYGKVRKYGTKKIMSNGEYPKAKDLNDFTKKVKTMKDFHLDIKGRAILDMFDIKAPLFNKRNGKPISLNKHSKVGGYCYRSITGETTEIALMAETGDSVWETENTIHECMHSKLRNSVSKAISEMGIKSEVRRETIRSEIEETIAEMAGQGVNNLIHGSATDKKRWSYEKIIAQAIPRIWGDARIC